MVESAPSAYRSPARRPGRRRPGRPAPGRAARRPPRPGRAAGAAPGRCASRSTAEQQPAYLPVGARVPLRPAGRAGRRRPARGAARRRPPPAGRPSQRGYGRCRRTAPSSMNAALASAAAAGVGGQQRLGGDQVGRGRWPGRRPARRPPAPGDQPAYVGVHHRVALPVREGGHGPRRVRTDAGQREQLRPERSGTSPPWRSTIATRALVQP